MPTLKRTKQFKKDYKLAKRQGKDLTLLRPVLDCFQSGTRLPPEYLDHPLQGKHRFYRECHLQPDWLLIYKPVSKGDFVYLTRLGSHSELF